MTGSKNRIKRGGGAFRTGLVFGGKHNEEGGIFHWSPPVNPRQKKTQAKTKGKRKGEPSKTLESRKQGQVIQLGTVGTHPHFPKDISLLGGGEKLMEGEGGTVSTIRGKQK